MIVLSQTTDSLKITSTGGVPVISSWRDRSSTTFVAGKSVLSASGTSDQIFVTGPCGSNQRIIDFISIYNPTSSSIPVTVKFDDGSTTAILYNGTVGPSQGVQYVEKTGFYSLDPSGAKINIIENSISPVPNPWSNIFYTGTLTTSSLFVPVNELAFYGETGGTYYFCWRFVSVANNQGTGIWGSVTGPGPQSPPFIAYLTEQPNSSDGINRTAQGATYGSPGAFPASTNNLSSFASASYLRIEGLIKLDSSTSGNIIPQVSCDPFQAGGSITILPGSYLQYHKLA